MPILRGLGSRVLSCGCLVGLYETYRGDTVAIIDAIGPDCQTSAHRPNTKLAWPIVDSTQRADAAGRTKPGSDSRPSQA